MKTVKHFKEYWFETGKTYQKIIRNEVYAFPSETTCAIGVFVFVRDLGFRMTKNAIPAIAANPITTPTTIPAISPASIPPSLVPGKFAFPVNSMTSLPLPVKLHWFIV